MLQCWADPGLMVLRSLGAALFSLQGHDFLAVCKGKARWDQGSGRDQASTQHGLQSFPLQPRESPKLISSRGLTVVLKLDLS